MRPSVSKFGSNCDQLVGTAIVRRLSLIAGLATLFFAALGLARSKRVSCLLEVRLPREVTRSPTSNYSPLTGTATGSNVNEISNTGQVVGVTVDANGAPTSTNFSATPCTTLTQLNTGAGQIAFRINSAGNLVGGNGTNAFFLLNGGSPQTLITPPGAINGFGINDKGNIVGQFTSGANTPGFILPSSASATFTTINQPAGVTTNVINAQGINNNGLVVGFYLGNDGQVHGFNANAPASPGGSITATANYRPDHPRQPQPTRRHVCVLPDPRVPGRPRQRCSTTAWRLPRSPGSPTRRDRWVLHRCQRHISQLRCDSNDSSPRTRFAAAACRRAPRQGHLCQTAQIRLTAQGKDNGAPGLTCCPAPLECAALKLFAEQIDDL